VKRRGGGQRRWWRWLRWPLAASVVAVIALLSPVAYVELACQDDPAGATYAPLITDPRWQRQEANSYLTYPEWHIVFAYDGLAHAVASGDEHRFAYVNSITNFWRSTCALTRVAGQHGGADWGTRSMVHTIGVSFTVEMLAKAAYEETVGRLTAWVRGSQKTPQDQAVTKIAADYAAFLRQTPWYEYPFHRKAQELWAAPIDQRVRGWERRIGIGLEFEAKAGYARVLAGAVAATEPAQLTIRSVISGLSASSLRTIDGVTVVGARAGGVEIETPRYAAFTRILAGIAKRGGTIREIAGNDEIMASLTAPEDTSFDSRLGTVLLRMTRDSLPGERLLVNVRLQHLAALLRTYPIGDPGLEHLFDY
jgi:hypothetical protein